MCLAQGHNTMMPVRLEPAAPQSRAKHLTIDPMHTMWSSSVDPDELPDDFPSGPVLFDDEPVYLILVLITWPSQA